MKQVDLKQENRNWFKIVKLDALSKRLKIMLNLWIIDNLKQN